MRLSYNERAVQTTDFATICSELCSWVHTAVDTAVTAPVVCENAVKAGSSFTGWYQDWTCTRLRMSLIVKEKY